jgi:hypothetical protein
MGLARQRILDARANRQASMTARYGTQSVQVPQPTGFPTTGNVEVRRRGRPPKHMDRQDTGTARDGG